MKIIKILNRNVAYAIALFRCERCNHECEAPAFSASDRLDCERCKNS